MSARTLRGGETMCTMTWMYHKNGYELFFNRDEAKTRLIAFPSEVGVANGVSFIAPIDADAGGTWMGVNAFGVSVCLLNGFGKVDRQRNDYVSRGALVMSLLDVPCVEGVHKRIAQTDLTAFRPFSLVVLEPDKPVQVWVWDGEQMQLEVDVLCPLISSSFKLKDVSAHRQRVFESLNVPQAKTLEDYHRSHVPQVGPFSVCMHREDAHTVSLSRVVVTQEQIHFFYAPGSPCKTDFLPPIFLPRHVDAGSMHL